MHRLERVSHSKNRVAAPAFCLALGHVEVEMTAKQITVMDAAVRLGVRYRTLLDWIAIGRVKGARVQGKWYADARDVERLRRELQETAGAAR